ncbi:MAG: DUF4262 domain-containing protein [Nakamurella sp.]
MCWKCDNPQATEVDEELHLWGLIDRFGWAVQYIEPGRRTLPWGYTVGLSAYGQPELVATGLRPEPLMNLLNSLAQHFMHKPSPEPGSRVHLIDGPVVEFVELSQPSAHLYAAVQMFGPRIRGIQAVHADDRGHWPWHPGFRGGRGGQPVLGPRAERREGER